METTTTETDGRTLVTGGDPDAPFVVPIFSGDFRDAPDLARIGAALIASCEELDDLKWAIEEDGFVIAYVWKKKAGKSADRVEAGTLGKAAGLAKHFATAAKGQPVGYVVALAADANCGQTAWQIEARVYHELCFPAGTMVTGPRPEASSMRWYAGQMIHVRTAAGHFLAGTPNHPVLTDRGWLPLQLVQEGDHVFGSRVPERVALAVDPHEHQVPAKIEQIACSGKVMLLLVPPSAEDLDAEVADDDVQVVGAGRDLDARPVSAIGQHRTEGGFAFGDGVGAALAGLGHLGERVGAVALASPRIVGSLQTETDGIGALTFGPDVLGHVIVSQGHSGVLQDRADGRATGADIVADLLGRSAGLVSRDQIVQVEVREFRGHVYNLETRGNWYFANGIIAHNCHCKIARKTVGKGEDRQTVPVLKTRAHDLEMFWAERQRYGDWRYDLKRGQVEFAQARLPIGRPGKASAGNAAQAVVRGVITGGAAREFLDRYADSDNPVTLSATIEGKRIEVGSNRTRGHRRGAGDHGALSDDPETVSSLLGDPGAPGAIRQDGNHDGGDDGIVADPDRVVAMLVGLGWSIAYRTTVGLGTGHYLDPQTGEPYGAEVVENAFRAALAGGS